MNTSFRFTYIVFFLFSSIVHVVTAQEGTFQSEKELKREADKLFEEGKFVEAYPIYSQLVLRNGTISEYNYHFGVCAIYSAADKEQAIPFLERAAANTETEKEVHYYLAKAYLLTYRFTDAITQFNIYKEKASAKDLEKFKVDQQISMCKNGTKLIRNITDWVVVNKKELNIKDFFLAYEISPDDGKLLKKPNEESFNTSLDVKKNEESVIFLAKDNLQILFSSYGEDGKHGKDIYRIVKLPNEKWSKPQVLPTGINTDEDEDYPFLHPNGKTLYFCSKGHSSMGGYDIFKSTYNEETNTWSTPENMGFPINSPDDDILYVTDKSEKEAFFSSARTSPEGKVFVYKLNLEKQPAAWILVKGKVKRNREGQLLNIRVTVKNLQDNSLVGVFNSNEKNGKYFLALPNGGNCLFTIESPNFKTQSETISLPLIYESKPMKQEISYDLKNNKLIIKTVTDAPEDDTDDEPVPDIVKSKARLDVTNKNGVKEKAKDIATEEIEDTDLNDTRLNNDDIIRMAYEDAKELDHEATELRKQADIALNLANQKNELALKKFKEAKELFEEAAQFKGDESQKKILLDKANEVQKEAEQLKQEAAVAYNLAKKMENAANRKRKEADLALQYARALEDASKAKKSPESMAKVSEIAKQMEDLDKNNTDTLSVFDSYKLSIESKQKELDKTLNSINEIKKEITDNGALIRKSEQEADNTRNKSLKDGLTHEIEGLKQDNLDKQDEVRKYEIKAKKQQNEYNELVKESEMAGNIANMAKNGATQPAATSVVVNDKNKEATTAKKTTTTAPPKKDVTKTLAAATTASPAQPIATATAGNNTTPATNSVAATKTTATTDTMAATQPVAVTKTQTTNTATKTTTPAATVATTDTTAATKPVAATQTQAMAINKTAGTVAATQSGNTTANAAATTATSPAQAVAVTKNKTTTTFGTVAPVAATTKTKADTVKQKTIAQTTPAKTAPNKTGANKPIPEKDIYDVLINIDKKYNSELATTEKIENEPEREKAKAGIYEKWAEELNRFASEQKQKLAGVTDLNKKAFNEKTINEAEQKLHEKKSLATQSNLKAQLLEQVPMAATQPADSKNAGTTTNEPTTTVTGAVAVTNTNTNTEAAQNKLLTNNKTNSKPETILTVNNETAVANNTELRAAEKILNAGEREKAKEAIYKKLAQKAKDSIVVLKLQYANETDPAKKQELTKKIKVQEETYKDDMGYANKSLIAAEYYFQHSKKEDAGLEEVEFTPAAKVEEKNTQPLAKTVPMAETPPKEKIVKNEPVKAEVKTVENTTQEKQKALPSYEIYSRYVIDKPKRQTQLAENEKFDVKPQPVYSDDKPIPPRNPKDGLIFVVQVGAFKNVIPQNTFGGITPITSEPTGTGYMRYMAGEFTQYSSAAEVKNEIRNLGFKDAFVVAFYNGKRIPLSEANKIAGGGTYAAGTDTPNTPATGNNTGTSTTDNNGSSSTGNYAAITYTETSSGAGTNQNTTGTTTAGTVTTGELNTTNTNASSGSKTTATGQQSTTTSSTSVMAKTENVAIVGGLFYTVQVGVFSQPMPAATFFNINPLFTETLEGGKIRYTVGMYDNLARAGEAKQIAANAGINAAFVTAFYNSKRISLTEAKQYESEGNVTFASSPVLNILPYFGTEQASTSVSSVNSSTQTSTNTSTAFSNNGTAPATAVKETPPATATTNSSTDEIVYKVQVGAYREEVPVEQASIYLKIKNKGFAQYLDANGITIYTVGNCQTYLEAGKLKLELTQQYGVKDAFIVVYKNGKKATFDEIKNK